MTDSSATRRLSFYDSYLSGRESPLFLRWWCLVFTVGCLTFLGCQPPDVETEYGRRRGSPGAASVNGTAVLSNMFEQAGHRVTSWPRLSPKLEQSQTIVWFRDDFLGPSPEQRQFLENWLESRPGRTLVYVGRDYDAAISYWRQVQGSAPPSQKKEITRRLALGQAIHEGRRAAIPDGHDYEWFVLRRDQPQRIARELEGLWAAGIDPAKAEINLACRLEFPQPPSADAEDDEDREVERPAKKFEQLLSSRQETLIGRITWDGAEGSQLLFVINGSFLLNLPLVNHEHRKLAHQLIAACGPPGRTVFLDSRDGGPKVYASEPQEDLPTGFEMFTVFPLGAILVHLTALGILACFALFPIFGRPRELTPRRGSDFGDHVDALGKLMEQVNDPDYAQQKIQTYRGQTLHVSKTGRASSSPVPPTEKEKSARENG